MPRPNIWTEEQDRILKESWNSPEVTFPELTMTLAKAKKTIINRASLLGLPKRVRLKKGKETKIRKGYLEKLEKVILKNLNSF